MPLPASTEIGCAIDQNVIALAFWRQFGQAKTTTFVQALDPATIQDEVANIRSNVLFQVWRLYIQLSAPWRVQTKPLTSFPALVVKENSAWKFERFSPKTKARCSARPGNR